MLNLFQPLPCRAIFSRDPCPLALGSKRALLPSLPALLHRPGRGVSFSLSLFFFETPRCRVLNAGDEIIYHTYENASLPPAVAGITLPRFARLVPTRERTRRSGHAGPSRTLTRPAFTRKAGDFREVDELVTWKASYGKKQGIFSCRKLSIRRWLLTLFCRLR